MANTETTPLVRSNTFAPAGKTALSAIWRAKALFDRDRPQEVAQAKLDVAAFLLHVLDLCGCDRHQRLEILQICLSDAEDHLGERRGRPRSS